MSNEWNENVSFKDKKNKAQHNQGPYAIWDIRPNRILNMMTSSNGNIFRVTGPLCGEFTGPGEFPAQRPVTRSFDVFFDLRSNKRLSKQPWGWWFETPSHPLWRQRNLSHASTNRFEIFVTLKNIDK